MAELEELEYVDVKRSGRGSRVVYKLVAGDLASKPLAGLISPAELLNRMAAAEKPARRARGNRRGGGKQTDEQRSAQRRPVSPKGWTN